MELPQGEATLLEFQHEGISLEFWKVEFDDGRVAKSWIKKESE